MADITYDAYKGEVLVISVVPSLDTPTCSLQTKRFNKEVTTFGDHVKVLTVSMDLPFAQNRWCGAEGVSNVKTASDYKYRGFGEAYGVLMSEMGLLARAVFVINKSGKVVYVDYVTEMSAEPNYDEVISSVKSL